MTPLACGYADRLVWYAGGRLDPEERRSVGRHLTVCRECRDDVDALRSMCRSIRGENEQQHVSSWDLCAYHDGVPALSPGEKRRVAGHLADCLRCSEDLELLRRAAVAEGAIPVRPVPRERRRVFHAAAAAVVILASVGLWGRRTSDLPPVPSAPTSVVFAPSQRSLETPRRLVGSGPWRIDVLLPLQSPVGPYLARVRRVEASSREVLRQNVTAQRDHRAVLLLPDLPGPGRYLLELALERDPSAVYVYGFDLARAP